MSSAPIKRLHQEMAADGKELRPVVHYDVSGMPADAGTIDVLARLQLDARRCQCNVRLRNASPELLELIKLCGLGETFSTDAPEPGDTVSGLD